MVSGHAHIDRHFRTRNCLHDNLIMNAFKQDAQHFPCHLSILHVHNIDILRTDDHIHRLVLLETKIYAVKGNVVKTYFIVLCHRSGDDVALPDKVCDIPVGRLVIDFLRGSYLLDLAVLDDDDLIGHSKRLLLVVGDKDKGDAHLLLNPFQLVLHLFPEL